MADNAWSAHVDVTTGNTYYVNSVTRVTSWECPPQLAEKKKAAVPEPENPTRKDWAMLLDSNTGRHYWANKVTGVTQWTEPPGWSTAVKTYKNWDRILDPSTNAFYYVNKQTQKVQWEEPQEATSPVSATGSAAAAAPSAAPSSAAHSTDGSASPAQAASPSKGRPGAATAGAGGAGAGDEPTKRPSLLARDVRFTDDTRTGKGIKKPTPAPSPKGASAAAAAAAANTSAGAAAGAKKKGPPPLPKAKVAESEAPPPGEGDAPPPTDDDVAPMSPDIAPPPKKPIRKAAGSVDLTENLRNSSAGIAAPKSGGKAAFISHLNKQDELKAKQAQAEEVAAKLRASAMGLDKTKWAPPKQLGAKDDIPVATEDDAPPPPEDEEGGAPRAAKPPPPPPPPGKPRPMGSPVVIPPPPPPAFLTAGGASPVQQPPPPIGASAAMLSTSPPLSGGGAAGLMAATPPQGFKPHPAAGSSPSTGPGALPPIHSHTFTAGPAYPSMPSFAPLSGFSPVPPAGKRTPSPSTSSLAIPSPQVHSRGGSASSYVAGTQSMQQYPTMPTFTPPVRSQTIAGRPQHQLSAQPSLVGQPSLVADRPPERSARMSMPAPIRADIARFQADGFTREHFRAQKSRKSSKGSRGSVVADDLVTWQKEAISHGVLAKSKKEDSASVNCFKTLQQLMGDVSTKKTHAALAKQILETGTKTALLRDEIFCQIAKQTKGNPSPTSTVAGWKMMALCCATLQPTRDFESFLLKYFVDNYTSPDPVKDIAAWCYWRLGKTLRYGSEEKQLTWEQYETDLARGFRSTQVTFDGNLDYILMLQAKEGRTETVPAIVPAMCDAIRKNGGFTAKGIFRIAADKGAIAKLRAQIEEKGDFSVASGDHHTPADILKIWLRSLQDPIIPKHQYDEALKACDNMGNCIALVKGLPRSAFVTLDYLMRFLVELMQPEYVKVTSMDAENLAIVFCQDLLRTDETDPQILYKNSIREKAFVRNLILAWQQGKV